MFLLEYSTSLDRFKKYTKTHSKGFKMFGFWERFLGIIFWPFLLGVFFYNFFKQLFK